MSLYRDKIFPLLFEIGVNYLRRHCSRVLINKLNWKAHFKTIFSTKYMNYVRMIYTISFYTLFQTQNAQPFVKSKPFSNAYHF